MNRNRIGLWWLLCGFASVVACDSDGTSGTPEADVSGSGDTSAVADGGDGSAQSDIDDGSTLAPSFECRPGGIAAPYPSSSPYVGVHANAQNNDLVACTSASDYELAWHSLQGHAIAQPNTFSPDGRTLYVSSSAGPDGGCTIHAVDTESGEVRWCLSEEGALGGSVTADADGNLFATTGAGVLSLTAEGEERWRRTWLFEDGSGGGPTGLHLHPLGYVAVATGTGEIALLDRADGSTVASLSVYDDVGLPRSERPGLTVDLEPLLPQPVIDDFVDMFGTVDQLLAIFAGVGSQWTDNTIGIAPDGTLYGIGTGPAAEEGALVQVRVTGTAEAPVLEPGWIAVFNNSSASSPSISPDGRFLKITDGNSTAGLLTPDTVDARALVYDIESCDANTDVETSEGRCGASFELPLLSGPALGAAPILNDGEHYLWEVQFADLFNAAVPDLIRYNGTTEVWRLDLPDDAVWSSVLTVTNNHIIGTMTRLAPSGQNLLTIALPSTASSELVVVDRATGEVVARHPTTDDSTSTVTIGPDGALYVTQLGLLSGFAIETRITGGIMRFSPVGE